MLIFSVQLFIMEHSQLYIILATIFEVLGSLFAGGQVTHTIRGEIINVSLFS